MPCGLVYSTIIWSMGLNSLPQSITLMLFFGLGTLPSMLSASILTLNLKKFFAHIYLKKIIGFFILIYGNINIINLFIIKNCH